MYPKMAWYREGEGIECAGDRFYCGVDYGWIERQINDKEREPIIIYDNLLRPLHIASYSLIGNMRDALYGTTLNFCMPLIRSTLHPGFHLNRRMNR
jgi:hypothetical protein